MIEIGIMQGRLSSPVPGRLQAFPWRSWEEEFHHARMCGFDTIEWLFQADGYDANPIWTDTGVERIRRQISDTGVQIRSVCADYFMVNPFFRVSREEQMASVEVLKKLLLRAKSLGVRVVLLPALETSEIRSKTEKFELLENLKDALNLAADCGIRVGLETELPAGEYRELIEQGSHQALGVYYDTGNAAAKGYDNAADFRVLHPFVCGVHIKDRKRNGPSVELGQGDADFAGFFTSITELRYPGPLVFQTAFGDDFLGAAKTHLNFVKELLALAEGRLSAK